MFRSTRLTPRANLAERSRRSPLQERVQILTNKDEEGKENGEENEREIRREPGECINEERESKEGNRKGRGQSEKFLPFHGVPFVIF